MFTRTCRRGWPAWVLGMVLAGLQIPAARGGDWPPVATFSICAFDPATGDLGVAVQSKFFGVGSVVPWAEAGVGAVATQSYANTRFGPDGLRQLRNGATAAEVVAALTAADEGQARRQLGVVDAQGRAASFTGDECLAWAGHEVGDFFCAQGNILAGPEVVAAMADTFRARRATGEGELADWLLAALTAAQEAGGDRRGRQSAALLVVRTGGGYAGLNDRYIDLRVEDHPTPIAELGRLLALHGQFYRSAHENPPRRAEPVPAEP